MSAAFEPVASRRFTILDAMLVLAAIGGAFWMMKVTVHAPPGFDLRSTVMTDVNILVLAMSVLVVACRLTPPRPLRAALFRPPGVAACLAAILAAFCTLAYYSADLFHLGRGAAVAASMGSRATGLAAAGAVVAVWTSMRLDGRWAPEPSSIDRLGRIVGAAWIILSLVGPAISFWVLWWWL